MSEKIVHMPAKAAVEGGLIHRCRRAFSDWNMRRLAKAELRSMPSHLLNDIGISRELIDQYVDGVISKRVAKVVDLDRSAGDVASMDRAKAA